MAHACEHLVPVLAGGTAGTVNVCFPPRGPLYVAARSSPYHGGLGVGQLLTWQLASKGAKAQAVRPSQDPGQEQAPYHLCCIQWVQAGPWANPGTGGRDCTNM